MKKCNMCSEFKEIHVIENLQYLTIEENRKKNNNHTVEFTYFYLTKS